MCYRYGMAWADLKLGKENFCTPSTHLANCLAGNFTAMDRHRSQLGMFYIGGHIGNILSYFDCIEISVVSDLSRLKAALSQIF